MLRVNCHLFFSRCNSLTYLNLSYCEHVTDAGVELLGTILSLMSVDLSGCLIQDQGISALGNNPRLRDITIASCSSVTDIGIQVSDTYLLYSLVIRNWRKDYDMLSSVYLT